MPDSATTKRKKVLLGFSLGGEGVGLDLDVSPGDLVDEAGLSHIGKPADEQGPGVGIDGRQTTQVLTDLVSTLYNFFSKSLTVDVVSLSVCPWQAFQAYYGAYPSGNLSKILH